MLVLNLPSLPVMLLQPLDLLQRSLWAHHSAVSFWPPERKTTRAPVMFSFGRGRPGGFYNSKYILGSVHHANIVIIIVYNLPTLL